MRNRHGHAVRLHEDDAQYEVISDDHSHLLLRRTDAADTRWVRPRDVAAMTHPMLAWARTRSGDVNRYLADLTSLPENGTGAPIQAGDLVMGPVPWRAAEATAHGIVAGFLTVDGSVHVQLAGEARTLPLVSARLMPGSTPNAAEAKHHDSVPGLSSR